MKGEDFDVVEIFPVGAQTVFRVESELLVGFAVSLGEMFRYVIDAVFRQPRAKTPLVIDEKLDEIPIARLDVVKGNAPSSVLADFPAGNNASSRQNRFGAWRRAEDRRRVAPYSISLRFFQNFCFQSFACFIPCSNPVSGDIFCINRSAAYVWPAPALSPASKRAAAQPKTAVLQINFM